MAAEILSDLSRATDSNSDPLAGAEWYFYASGTLTPQSVYTTSALSVAHANPVVADAGGQFAPIYFDASLQYRGILKDSSGNTIRDIDPINAGILSALAASTGAASVGFIQTGTGATASTVQDELRRIAVTPQQFSGLNANGADDDSTAFAAAIAAADAGSKVLRIPPVAVDYVLGSTLTIPDGLIVLVEHRIIGLGTTGIVQMGSSTIIFNGGEFRNCQLKLTGGSPKVYGFKYTGYNFTSGISIVDGDFTGLVIDGLDIRTANYGILRTGTGSTLNGARIANGYFYDLVGDPIQFDLCPDDKNITIENHVIDKIDAGSDPGGVRANWGMGIGLSGTGYDNTFPDAKTVKQFVIRNIWGSRCRRLVHIEAGARFSVENIHGEDITETYSVDSGLDCAIVGIYASTDFTIDGVHGDGAVEEGGILILDGGTVPNQNFTLRNVDLFEGAVWIQQGNDSKITNVENVLVRNGSFRIDGRTGNTYLSNVKAFRPAATGVAMNLNMNTARTNEATTSRLVVRGCDARDETNALSITLSISSVGTRSMDSLREGLVNWTTAAIAASGTLYSSTFTVTGAEFGDAVDVGLPGNPDGLLVYGYIHAADTCRIALFNPTGGAIDPPDGNYLVKVRSAR